MMDVDKTLLKSMNLVKMYLVAIKRHQINYLVNGQIKIKV